ncbi:VOC family protein [Pseudonocardia alni]|uniref:VOC family protein n=1 Tax=Pseudonocardia alni TaxID=33907 RepID=UPI003407EABE
MSLLGVHHIGVSVLDLPSSLDRLAGIGFTGPAPERAAGPDASTGNGIDGVDMHLAFLRDATRCIELLAHARPRVAQPPRPGAAGYEKWTIVDAGSDAPRRLVAEFDGLPVYREGGPVDGFRVTVHSPDPEATARLLKALGLEARSASRFVMNGLLLEVLPVVDGEQAVAPRADDVGRSHLALQVADLPAAHRALVEAGFEPISDPLSVGEDFRWLFVRDPGGSGEIELIEDHSVTPVAAHWPEP